MNNFLIILLSVFLGSIGQVILKLGADKLGSLSLKPATLLFELLRVVKTPEIAVGLLFFGSSFLLWIKVLTRSNLSYAYPMVALGYINVAVLSYFLFHESITFPKLLGIALIVMGVIVLNY